MELQPIESMKRDAVMMISEFTVPDLEVAAFGDTLAVELEELRGERLFLGHERALDVVPRPRAEPHAGPFPLHDQPHSHALHAT